MALKKRKVTEEENELYSEVTHAAGKLSATTKTTVAVAGVMGRIGTTTQALHIANYLFYNGKNVAYVEMNDHGFLDMLEKVYEDVKHDKNGNLVYERMTMVKAENLHTVTGKEYDYLVYDFGSVTDKNFAPMYEQSNVQVLVGGSAPEEYYMTTLALSDRRFEAAKVIFSFCPQDDQSGILNWMTARKDTTFFAKYAPDYFKTPTSMDDVYKQILPEVK